MHRNLPSARHPIHSTRQPLTKLRGPRRVLAFTLVAVALTACGQGAGPTATPTVASTAVVTQTATPTAVATATGPATTTATPTAGVAAAADYRDATYVIDGRAITLANGLSEVPAAPGSASKITTRYFGNEASGDLNGDGMTDVAFLLTQDGGGSGTFFYVVVALKTADGYVGTNAVLLGDRIAPQTTEIHGDQLVVNYATRKDGEAMTAQPSVGVSKYLKVVDGKLEE